jgi:hypothetical protein
VGYNNSPIMALSYEEAIAVLYQAAHESFVAERKRLSSELKAQGDKPGAARLMALARPPVSAWAVNQLWWRARDEMDRLFAAAARQRVGERAAAAEHRDLLAHLRSQAGELLRAAGHAASEGTLRRVTTTLGALSVIGSFEPDPPGALSADRDPPGFDALSLGDTPAFAPRHAQSEAKAVVKVGATEGGVNEGAHASGDKKEREAARRAAQAAEAEQRRQQAEQARERERKEAERARRQAERERLVALLEQARGEFDACERAASERRKELRAAEAAAEQARNDLNAARARLKDFDSAHK